MIEIEAPAPVETVTSPIKPSEAIRLGCLLAPIQAKGYLFEGTHKACVIGAMALGYGYDGPRDFLNDEPAWELVRERLGSDELVSGAWSRNDGGWSRERIADWLAEQGL